MGARPATLVGRADEEEKPLDGGGRRSPLFFGLGIFRGQDPWSLVLPRTKHAESLRAGVYIMFVTVTAMLREILRSTISNSYRLAVYLPSSLLCGNDTLIIVL